MEEAFPVPHIYFFIFIFFCTAIMCKKDKVQNKNKSMKKKQQNKGNNLKIFTINK